MYTYTHILTYIIHVCICTYLYMYVYIYIYIYIFVNIHVYMYVFMIFSHYSARVNKHVVFLLEYKVNVSHLKPYRSTLNIPPETQWIRVNCTNSGSSTSLMTSNSIPTR